MGDIRPSIPACPLRWRPGSLDPCSRTLEVGAFGGGGAGRYGSSGPYARSSRSCALSTTRCMHFLLRPTSSWSFVGRLSYPHTSTKQQRRKPSLKLSDNTLSRRLRSCFTQTWRTTLVPTKPSSQPSHHRPRPLHTPPPSRLVLVFSNRLPKRSNSRHHNV